MFPLISFPLPPSPHTYTQTHTHIYKYTYRIVLCKRLSLSKDPPPNFDSSVVYEVLRVTSTMQNSCVVT